MRISWLFLLVFTIASELVRVNDKNFNQVVKGSGKFTLVDFYADWCRHCMKLMPTIEKLAETFADTPDIQIVKINGDADGRKMTNKYDIPGFPTLLLFHGDDEPIEFDGMRDHDSIRNFIQKISGAKSRQQNTEDFIPVSSNEVLEIDDHNFQDLILDAKYKTMLIFTAPWCRFCKEVKPLWSKLANEIYESDQDIVRFAELEYSDEKKSATQKIKAQFNVRLLPTILFFNPFKVDDDGLKRPVQYDDERNLESLLAFVNDETGLSRKEDGKLFSNAGRIMSIDEAIETSERYENVLAKLEKLENLNAERGRDALVDQNILFFKDDVSMIPYYMKVVKKLRDGDEQYIVNEAVRLEMLISLEEKNMERSAFDYMQKRLNVLTGIIETKKL